MSAQTTPDQSFPAACKHCGGLLYQYVDFCPYCGTDRPLDAVALSTRPKATVSAFGPPASAPPVPSAAELSPAGMPASELPSALPGDVPPSPFEQESTAWQMGRSIFSKGALLVWFVLAIACIAYLLFGESRKQEGPGDDQNMHSSVGSVAQYAPEQQAPMKSPTAETAPPYTSPKVRVVPPFKDVPDMLRAARESLAGNNLSDAKAEVSIALAHDSDNQDALAIQRDIATREQHRDAALHSADECASLRIWACVQQHASEALAIDSSSQSAQALMERAILATAWTAPGAHAPNSVAQGNAPPVPLKRGAGPGPGTAKLYTSQNRDAGAAAVSKDTSAAAPAASASAANTAPANPNSANASDTAGVSNNAATAASPSSDPEAQERAIVQFGWKHAAPADASH